MNHEPTAGRSSNRLWPSVADLVFVYVLVVGFGRDPSSFLSDPDTFWHLRVGQEIQETGRVPWSDTLTYTRAGTPWLDQSWAYDWVLAGLFERWEWSGVIAGSVLLLAWLYWGVARWAERLGFSALTVLAVSVFAFRLGEIHFLARPHLVSFVLALWMFRACRAFHEGRERWLWCAPVVMALWANCHGGFLAGLMILGCSWIGEGISGRWNRDRLAKLARLGVIGLLSLLAPLANPYGLELYRHVFALLVSSGLTNLNEEFQPVRFTTLSLGTMEIVVLALIVLPTFSRLRQTRFDLTHALAWFHLGMSTIRYTPLFGIAVVPGLGRLIEGLIRAEEPQEQAPARLNRPWVPLLATCLVVLAIENHLEVGGLKAARWPLAALPVLNRQPADAPLFHEQDWGGMVEAGDAPRRKAFIDSRFEVFGKAMIVDYLDALEARESWDRFQREWRFQLVWLRPNRPLARSLEADPAWEILHKDEISILLRRKSW